MRRCQIGFISSTTVFDFARRDLHHAWAALPITPTKLFLVLGSLGHDVNIGLKRRSTEMWE